MRTFLFLLLWSSVISAADSRTLTSSDQQTALLELYTSEGCSSCPPADQWLSRVIGLAAGDLDVLALAFHVDYWDYIGWKDPLGSPQHTERQRQLAKANRQSSIYTPEFFINGREVRGTRKIIERIQQANQTTSAIALQLDVNSEPSVFQLNLKTTSSEAQNLRVQYVVYEDELVNQVTRGENAGRQLQHQHVVRYLSETLSLGQNITHRIPIQREWKREHLGVAAIVYRDNGDYLQAVHGSVL